MLGLIQVLSLLCVVAVVLLARDPVTWSSIVASTTFGHYILGVLYARRPIALIAAEPSRIAAVAVLGALAVALFWVGFPVVVYFGLHSMLNEIYIEANERRRQGRGEAALRASAVALHLLAYGAILRRDVGMSFAPPALLFAGVLVAALVYAALLLVYRPFRTPAELLERTSFQIVALILVVVSLKVRVSFLQVIFYHVVFWFWYPLTKLRHAGTGPLLRYLATTAALTLAFLLISPLGVPRWRVPVDTFRSQLVFWAWTHITISFAISRAHPAWINRWFAPSQAPGGRPVAPVRPGPGPSPDSRRDPSDLRV